MKLSATLILVIIFLSSAMAYDVPGNLVQPKDQALVQSSLERTIAKFNQDEPIKAWIFFTDKGFSTLSEYDAKLQEAENSLTERAKYRRLKARGRYNLVDFHDIPVNQPYIDGVLACGGKLRRVLRWLNAITIEADAATLNRIAELPYVLKFKHVGQSSYRDDYARETTGNGDLPLTATSLEYGYSLGQLEQINTVVAHELGFAGQDVLVCMMDTGFRQSHVAFQAAINEGRLIAQYDFVNNDDNTDYDPGQETENQPRHGTYTWSALGGQSSGNLYGPAYLADFCLSKTEDVSSEHHTEEDNWAAGAEWADSLGAAVISASLGYRYDFTPPDEDYQYEDMNGDGTIVTIAADLAAQRGIAVATAQGNDGGYGDGSLIAPADGDSVIACGAVESSDNITNFSALGPTYDGRIKPEVCALGSGTACADPSNMNGFTWVSGTSLSTPLIGGVTAVLLSAHPNWTPMMVREALMMNATNATDPNNTYGWGIVDIGKALFYHPEGDIIIEHEPLIYFPAGLDNNVVNATITGGSGINNNQVYLYWRTDENDPFTQTRMYTGGNDLFDGIVPGLDDGYLQYYIYAEDTDGAYTTYPYGSPDHYLTVYIDSTEFFDSFENGLYYWKTEGTNGNWALTAERAATGNISVTDSPYRDYNNNAELTLTSNFSIGLYGAEAASVSFKTRYIIQSNYDMVYFEVSTDNGQSWQVPGPVFTGTQVNFVETSIDLADYLDSAVMFRFRMVTNESGQRDGIHIDDFRVTWDNPTGITDNGMSIPSRFNLYQNYPNPFNPSTVIKFNLVQPEMAELIVYDMLGKKVKTLVSDILPGGAHEVIWDGTDESGDDVASGIYMYKLKTDNFSQIKQMTLLR